MSIKNRKLQVFVSSTFTDLREERQAAVEAILSTGNIPAGMELFAAGDQSQMEVIKEWIQESDVYLLILGGRYGTIEPNSGKSYTQLEYEYALEIGKPHFTVVTSEKALNAKVKKHGLEMTERGSTERYNEFKELVSGHNKVVEYWNDLKGIELSIHKSLAKFSKREELIGWVRGDQAVNSGALAEELARLGKENAVLRNEVEQLRRGYDGLSFEELYEFFENRKYPVEENDGPPLYPYFNKAEFKIKMNRDLLKEVSANDVLLIRSDNIFYGTSINHGIEHDFFKFLEGTGIVEITQSKPSNIGLPIKYTPRFTKTGRSYFYRLRTLEKYKDWQV